MRRNLLFFWSLIAVFSCHSAGVSEKDLEEFQTNLERLHGNALAEHVRANEKLQVAADTLDEATARLTAAEQLQSVAHEQLIEASHLFNEYVANPPYHYPLEAFPIGTILIWDPSVYSRSNPSSPVGSMLLPEGWAFCNGENGTPDLTGRFLLGVSRVADASKQGGASTHTHSGEAIGTSGAREGSDQTMVSPAAHTHQLDIDEANHVPPNYSVIFIVKVEEIQ